MRGLEYLNDDDVTRGRKKISNKPPAKKSDHKHNYVVIKEAEWEFSRNLLIITSECSVCKKKKTETKFA